MAEIKLDLSKEEEQGYYSLLAFSQLSIGEFCFYNKFEHKQGLDVLNSLKEKKLIAEVKGLTDRFIPQFPFLNISEKFVEPAQKFNELKTNLQTFFETKEKEITDNQAAKVKEVNDTINPKINELQTADETLKTNTAQAITDLETEMKSADESFAKTLADNRSTSKTEVDGKRESLVTQTTTKGSETEKSVLESSKTLKDSTNKVVSDFFAQTDSSILAELVKSFNSLKESITSLNAELESYEQKFSADSTNLIQESETETENAFTTSKENFGKLATNIKSAITEEQEALQLLNLEFADLQKYKDSESALVKPFVDLRNVLDASTEELVKVRDEFNTQITEIIQTDTNNTKETLENSKSGFNQSFTALVEARTKQGESITTQLQEKNTENSTTAQEFVKGQERDVEQLNTSSQSALATTKSELLDKHSQASQETDGQIENIQSKTLPDLTNSITSWNISFEKTFETVKQTTNEQYDGIHQTLDQMMTDVKEQYEENAKQIQELLAKQSELLQTKFTDLQAQLPPKKTSSIEAFTTANSQVASEITTLQQTLETQINGVKTLLENHQQSVLTELPEKISGDLDTLASSMAQHAESMKAQLNTFLTEWSAKTQEFTDNWISLEGSLRSSEEASLKESNGSLNSDLDVLGKKASELRVDLITKAKNQNKTLNESLTNAVKSGSDNLSNSYGQLLKSLNASVDEFNTNSDTLHTEQLTSLKSTYEGVKSSLSELMSNTRTSTDTKLQEQVSSVDQTSTTSQETYNTNKNTALTTVTGNVDKTFANIDTTNQSYYKALLELQSTFASEMGTLIETFETSLSDLTMNQMKSLISSLQEKFSLFNKTQELISTSVAGFVETESTVRQSLTDGVDEQAKLLQTNLKDHAGQFEQLAKVGEDLLTPPSTLLDKFNGLVTDYAYPKIESSGIIGWSSTIVQVKNMMKAMKTRVTLLVPNPDDLADLMESIQNAKRPKRVDISSQFDTSNNEHVALIRKLLNQDNVTLRNIVEKMGTDSKYPPFLACDRDGEEVMFGTQDPSNKTAFVGMVSQIEPFIHLMGKVVLSDFLSKAKKINQGDF